MPPETPNTCRDRAIREFNRRFGTAPKHDLTAAHTVFWNIQGRGDSNWQGAPGNVVVASQQSRYGYVIGTRGTRSEVNVGVYYGSSASAVKTAPVDFVVLG